MQILIRVANTDNFKHLASTGRHLPMIYYSPLPKSKKATARFMLVSFLLMLLNSITFNVLYAGNQEQLIHPIGKQPIILLSFMAVVLAPLLETLVFQYSIINLCIRYAATLGAYTRIVALILSTSAFALSHSYSSAYQLSVICPGLIMANMYWQFRATYNQKTAFGAVAGFHAFLNLCVVLFHPAHH